MKTHDLKTHTAPFQAVWERKKNFELRVNDRNYQVGDLLRLREYKPEADTYTGRIIIVQVTYMLQNEYNLPIDLCVMSIDIITLINGEF